jgi:phosphoribosyl 1,2-cyclic phosphodiesterase
MRVTSFGSGSCGNAFLIQSGETALLIDSGISIRRLRTGLAAAGVAPDSLTAVLVSHEHHDHVRSLTQIVRYYQSVVMATPGTLSALGIERTIRSQSLPTGRPHQIGRAEVLPLPVSHDAAEPVGFFIDDGETRVAVFTDLGRTGDQMAEVIADAHLVILESNYDELMLERGRYPRYLKRRIGGQLGHLSNRDCARFLAQHLGSRTVEIWLAHLSANNNTPARVHTILDTELGRGSAKPRIRVLPRRGDDTIWNSGDLGNERRQLALPIT